MILFFILVFTLVSTEKLHGHLLTLNVNMNRENDKFSFIIYVSLRQPQENKTSFVLLPDFYSVVVKNREQIDISFWVLLKVTELFSLSKNI